MRRYKRKLFFIPRMIFADIHEPVSIISILGKKAPVKVARNTAADYMFKSTGIERKTLSDFFSSVAAGRLFTQLENLLAFEKPYLIIEGFFDFSYVNNLPFLYRTLQSITIDLRANIIFTRDAADTAAAILRIYYQDAKPPELKARGRGALHAVSLRSFFHISPAKFNAVFSEIKSVRELASTDKQRLMKIKGVGIRTAGKIGHGLDREIIERFEKPL